MISLENILEVSEKNFFAKSYQDVKLDNIANDLNIKKPSLYYYFSNKKEIFLETLKYSMKKYVENLKDIILEKDIDKFLDWYLVYPSEKKNLFAIALHHQYLDLDKQIYSIIMSWKRNIYKLIYDYLSNNFAINKTKIYLMINLLDQLAKNNCIDDYCLKCDIKDVKIEIKKLFKCSKNI